MTSTTSKKTPKKAPPRTTVRLSAELAEAVSAAAKDAGMAVADFHRFALRQAMDSQAVVAELAGLEERQAAQISKLGRRLTEIQRTQQLQFAVLDQFIKLALALEPEFVDGTAKTAARATGNRRYNELMASVPAALSGPLAKFFADALASADAPAGDGA